MQTIIKIRKSADREHINLGWLNGYHSFLFSNDADTARTGFSALRAINEDTIAPAQGFGMHSHRDMEIVTYMFSDYA